MAALVNDRNELLYSASSRVTGAKVSISPGAATTIIFPKGTTIVPVPATVTLTASTSGYVAPSFTWSYRFGDTGNFTAIAATTNPITVTTNTAFATAAGTNTLVQYKVIVAETSGNLGVNQSEYTLSIPILREGVNGINSIMLTIYKRTTTNVAPTFTAIDLASNSVYVFATGNLVGQPADWSMAIPAATTGAYLWSSQVQAASVTGQYTFINTLWSTPVLYATDGSTGTPGTNTAIIYAYQRSATALTSNPGAIEYSFSTNSITTTTLANSWLKAIPAGSDPLYVTLCTAASTTSTDTVAASEWTTPVLMVKDGKDGINNATVYLYARNSNSSTAPTLSTTGSCVYTFSNGTLSGTSPNVIPAGWTTTIPAESGGTVVWVVQATAASNGTTDTITNTEWSTPRVLGQQGSNGNPGTRGSRQLYASSTSYNSTYTYLTNAAGAASYAAQATALIAAATTNSTPTTPIKGDTVTFSNGTTYVYTITYNSDTSAWETPGTIIDGSLLVTGSVTAAKINSNGLSIKDANGNVILSAGVPLEATNINAPASWVNSNVTLNTLGYTGDIDATKGAQSGTNLKDSSGTVIKDDAFRNNLTNVDWWKRDASIPWSQNNEYNRIISVNPGGGGDLTEEGPRGGNDLVWYCQETNNDGQSGGGWNANLSSTLDPNKTYRFAIAIRVGNNNGGTAYWGTQNVCDLNTTNVNGNPYFAVFSRDSMVTDRWYLFVGYVFPYNSTGNSSDSAGVWDCKTGIKVASGTNYCHNSTAANNHRAYQYYAGNGANQRFSRPMVNMVDGTEPSLREYFVANAVLNNAISISNAGTLTNGTGTTSSVSISGLGYTGALDATKGAPTGTYVAGTLAETVVSNAAAVTDKLNKAGGDILTGVISVNNTTTVAGLRIGDLIWDSTGARTSGKGVALTQKGIVGHNGTKVTFAIDATSGDATFAGTLDVQGSTAGSGSMTIGNNSIIIKDSAGTIRVKLGSL